MKRKSLSSKNASQPQYPTIKDYQKTRSGLLRSLGVSSLSAIALSTTLAMAGEENTPSSLNGCPAAKASKTLKQKNVRLLGKVVTPRNKNKDGGSKTSGDKTTKDPADKGKAGVHQNDGKPSGKTGKKKADKNQAKGEKGEASNKGVSGKASATKGKDVKGGKEKEKANKKQQGKKGIEGKDKKLKKEEKEKVIEKPEPMLMGVIAAPRGANRHKKSPPRPKYPQA